MAILTIDEFARLSEEIRGELTKKIINENNESIFRAAISSGSFAYDYGKQDRTGYYVSYGPSPYFYTNELQERKIMNTASKQEKESIRVEKMEFFESFDGKRYRTFCVAEIRIKKLAPQESKVTIGKATWTTSGLTATVSVTPVTPVTPSKESTKISRMTLVGMARMNPKDAFSPLVGRRTSLTDAIKSLTKEQRVPVWEHFKRHFIDTEPKKTTEVF